jgi:SAM-dependent methyltransferase
MHEEQQEFFRAVRGKFPDRFVRPKVYDFGSLDINGNNRGLFEEPDYLGIDICEGRNVDVVGRAHEVELPGLADVCISGEMLEHDEHWVDSIQAMAKWCRPGGLVLFSCASRNRPEHGTRRTTPADSPLTLDYYHNLTAFEVSREINLSNLFSAWKFEYNPCPGDLYFWGVRHVALPDIPASASAG